MKMTLRHRLGLRGRALMTAVLKARALTAGVLLAAVSAVAVANDGKADLVVTNARVATLDSRSTMAEALAVRDGRIVAVGPTTAIESLVGPATRRVDAGGRTVIPGLIDSHLHGVRAGLSYSTEVNWIGAATIAEAMDRLRQKAASSRPGAWLIVAGGWSEQQFAERRRPTLAEVQAAVPDNPTWIQLFYDALLLNDKAREALGLAGDRLPDGIKAGVDAAGKLADWWTASIVVTSALFDRLPKPTYQDNLTGTRQFFSELNRLAVTGFVDTGGFSIEAPQYAALMQLWREKAMTVRIAYHLFAQKRGVELDEFRRQTQLLPMGFGDDMLKFNGIGERITLAMYNNYAPNAEVSEQFFEAIRWAAEQRMSLTVHWAQAKSVPVLLDLFERVDKTVTPIRPLRWSIAHLEDVTTEHLTRMAALGVAWSTQLGPYYHGDEMLASHGDAARRMPPLVSALKAGVQVAVGTDAHRVASYNPFLMLQWALDGKTIRGTALRSADEIPSREAALRMMTVNSAWFSFDDGQRGTLEVGKLADFAILDRDFFSVPAEAIGATTSLMTVVGGRVVHAAGPLRP